MDVDILTAPIEPHIAGKLGRFLIPKGNKLSLANAFLEWQQNNNVSTNSSLHGSHL